MNYQVDRESGSHKVFKSPTPGRPPLYLAFHDDADIPPGLVRKIMVRDVGLTEADALDLL